MEKAIEDFNKAYSEGSDMKFKLLPYILGFLIGFIVSLVLMLVT